MNTTSSQGVQEFLLTSLTSLTSVLVPSARYTLTAVFVELAHSTSIQSKELLEASNTIHSGEN